MEFGPIPVQDALGAVLAHSLRLKSGPLKKGTTLTEAHLESLAANGIEEVIAAVVGPEDLNEDEAAARILAALFPDPIAVGASVSAPFTGRANAFALSRGVLRVDTACVNALNEIDEATTVATLPDFARVDARQMLATVKIIPYAVSRAAVEAAEALALAAAPVLRVAPAAIKEAQLFLTQTPGMRRTVLDKGAEAIGQRLSSLGVALSGVEIVPHRTEALAEALRETPSPLALVLAGSATSDRRDVTPAAIEAAGGRIERLGMPVDPGNLLVLGELEGQPVLGLPGCARSPKLNGADWVLERLVCRVPVSAADIAAMGVGGLLKEIPSRPQPRAGKTSSRETQPARRPFISGLLLAAGGSRRMGPGQHKLLEDIDGQPLLRRSADQLRESAVDEVVVVVGAEADQMRAVLVGTAAEIVEAADWQQGMAASLRAGMRAISPRADAVLIALADMPEVDARLINRVMAAFDAEEGREIVRPMAPNGRPGQPVLFGRRFFESLNALSGDQGARSVVQENDEFVVDVYADNDSPLVDLDTPEAWRAWRAKRVEPSDD
ncbi:MAG: molybdopterin-binding/glycosyltransferase family 2 protein [Pseudomonadota bacterium]